MSDFSDHLLYASRAAPRLDPSIVAALAQGTDDPSALPDIASATEGFSQSNQYANTLKASSAADQLRVWGLMPKSQQQLLVQQGYTPPKAPDKSFFGKVTSAIGTGLHDIGVPQTLHGLGAPLRGVQHAVRFLEYRNEDPLLQNAGIGTLLSTKTIARLWRETTDGESTVDPRTVRALQSQYGDEKLGIARALSSGTSPEELAMQQPEGDRLAFVQNLQNDPDLKAIITQLGDNKMSFGRLIVKELHLPGHASDPGSLAGRISGAGDAIFDWFADPVAMTGRGAKLYEVKKYGLRDVSDLTRIMGDADQGIPALPGVRRFFDKAGGYLADGNTGGLAREFPFMDNVAGQLVTEGVDSADKLQEWFKSQVGMEAILRGRASGVTAPVPIMAHLSPAGSVRLATKGAFKTAIDFLADTPARIDERLTQGDLLLSQPVGSPLTFGQSLQTTIATPIGRFARSLTTLLPKGTEFNPGTPGAPTQLRRVAALFLPGDRVDEIMSSWHTAPTLGAKKEIYKGMLSELFRAAAMDATPEASAYASRFVDTFDRTLARRLYTTNGADRMVVNGKEMAAGILEGDLTTSWGLPNFRVMWAQSKRASMTRSIFGAINNNGIDTFMEKAWKPSVLLRLGFPIRAAGEEFVAAAMRAAPLSMVQSRLGFSAAKGEALGTADRLMPWDPSAYISERLAGHISPEIMSGITQPAEWAGAVLGDRARRAFRNVEGRLAGQAYMNEARSLFSNGLLEGGLADEISAIHGDAGGYIDTPDQVMQLARDGRKVGRLQMVGTGDYRQYEPTDPLYKQMWKHQLDKAGQSKLAQLALENFGDRQAQIDAIGEHLDSPGFAKMRTQSIRDLYTRDGREVGVDATSSEATKDWANLVADHVDSLVIGPNGDPLPGLVETLLADGKGPSLPKLNEFADHEMPTGVVGKDMIPMPKSWLSSVMSKGFDEVVGRPMNWIAREPMFLHESALARANVEPFRELFTHGITDPAELEQANLLADAHINDIVMERALAQSIPYIHDPQVRSQFSSVTRNFMPFWFAQEQFYKRWAKTFTYAPEAFREGQLALMGLRHSGMVHRDDQGNDYFFYPFANVVQNTLTSAYKAFTGKDIHLPIPAALTGQIRFVSAGTERLGLPSFGPLMAMPVHAFVDRFPELQAPSQKLLGDRGVGKAYWEQITPSSISRVVHFMADSPETNSQMSSAVMQAMQLLDAAGHGLPDGATSTEYEQWVDRVRGWSRTLALTRTVFGFAAPAAPEVQFDPAHLNERLRSLMRTLTMDEALKQFAVENPNATAYTVFRSQAKGNEPLPATEHLIPVLNDNKDFLKAYPMAGGWFLPQAPVGDKFSFAAYREAFALGLLAHKTPTQFYKDLKFSEAAAKYFPIRDERDALLASAKGDTYRRATINAQWSDYSKTFLATHPIFRDELALGQGRVRRQDTMDQLRQAFADPRAPRTDQTNAMENMLNVYDEYKARNAALANRVGGYQQYQQKALKDTFLTWVHGQTAADPALQGFYDRLIRTDVE